MILKLEPINIGEHETEEIYSSADCQTLLKIWKEYYTKIGFNFPWVGYLVKRNSEIVGSCAFVGKPKDNTVEISYWTFKEFEGKGIATFSCEQLIAIAKTADPTLVVTAKTAPELNASTKVLERNGFIFSRVVQDDDIGDAWEWILNDKKT